MIKDVFSNSRNRRYRKMIRDVFTGEVIEEKGKLTDNWEIDYSKLLNKKNKYNYKCAGNANVSLDPYSRIFSTNYYSSMSFNNKKFSII